MGRIARWASARDYDALIVINEDRKVASASLPALPASLWRRSRATHSC